MIAHPPFRSEWLLLMALAVSACARAQSQPTSLVVSPLSSDMRTAMTGKSWKPECPVSLDDLAAVNVGQIVSSTQWNAEFASYQAIWKGMVAVRTLADKLVLREGQMTKLGLPNDYLASAERMKIRKELISKFVEAAQSLLLAIHENAPFYPTPIRKAANDTHAAAKDLIDQYLAKLPLVAKGIDVTTSEQVTAENETTLRGIIEGVDFVETMIRDRLATIEVVNNARL